MHEIIPIDQRYGPFYGQSFSKEVYSRWEKGKDLEYINIRKCGGWEEIDHNMMNNLFTAQQKLPTDSWCMVDVWMMDDESDDFDLDFLACD